LILSEHEQTPKSEMTPKRRWDLVTAILPPALALPSVSFSEDLQQGVGLEMVKIPGGNFLMGSLASEIGHSQQEAPQTQVAVADCWMSKFPITQIQWKAVSKLPLVNRSIKANPSKFKGSHHPVESISWYDAVEFCNRLIQHTGKPYRLPSEAEWEYACRAGTDTAFHFGETLIPTVANYGNNSSTTGKNFNGTNSVGQYQVANLFGLYDMHGNVWEWCTDCWRKDYTQPEFKAGEFPENHPRVTRGGSWFDDMTSCRSASRMADDPEIPASTIGFRVIFSFL
jgi:formylglycine-generating enzyme required for sulfatase activity